MVSSLHGSFSPAYGPKSNLPDNFDPNIGARSRKPASSTTVNILDTSVSTSSSRTLAIEPPPACSSSHSSSPLLSTLSSVSPHLSPPPIIMHVGSFPPLSSVKDIKEFDGSPKKLNDFLALVEDNLAVYNIPLSQGGFVAGNMDDG